MKYPNERFPNNSGVVPEAPGGGGGYLIPLGVAGAFGLSEQGRNAAQDLIDYLRNIFSPPPPPVPYKVKSWSPSGYEFQSSCPGFTGDTWVLLSDFCYTGQFAAIFDPDVHAPAFVDYAEDVGGNKYSVAEIWARTSGPISFQKPRVLPYEDIDPFTEADNYEAHAGIETKAPPLPLRNPARIQPLPIRQLTRFAAIQWATAQGSQRGNTINLPVSVFDAFPDVAARPRTPARPQRIAQTATIALPQRKPQVIPGFATRAIPAKNVREKKMHVTMFGQTLPARIFGQITESLDLIDCMYQGIPGKLAPRNDNPIFGSTDYRINFRNPIQSVRRVPIHGFRANSAQKAQAVFDHFGAIDWQRAVAACLINELIDNAGAIAGKSLGLVSRGLGLPVGLQSLKSVLKI